MMPFIIGSTRSGKEEWLPTHPEHVESFQWPVPVVEEQSDNQRAKDQRADTQRRIVKEHEPHDDAGDIRCYCMHKERKSVADRDERGPDAEMHLEESVERKKGQPRVGKDA